MRPETLDDCTGETMQLVLASKSPRRESLLSRIHHDFVVVPSGALEPTKGEARARVMISARRKARAVGSRVPGIILGADTVVCLEDQVLGKPASRDDAARMLRLLSGQTHRVLTGLYLWHTETRQECESCNVTDVRFREIRPAELEWYLDSGEFSDKAGAYGIQGRAAVFVAGISGEYTNVMGLPLCELSRLFREMGIGL
jgi:septum formation protein